MTLAERWRAFKNWQPNHVFYETVLDKYVAYDEPAQLGLGFTSDGYWTDHKEYTRLGQWFVGKPFLLYAFVAVPYYLLAWPLWYLSWFCIVMPVELLLLKWD